MSNTWSHVASLPLVSHVLISQKKTNNINIYEHPAAETLVPSLSLPFTSHNFKI